MLVHAAVVEMEKACRLLVRCIKRNGICIKHAC
jgi:hypothetical protein